jgi:hypothetical protein
MSKPRGDPSCGTSSEAVLIPTERNPAYRQREARSGSGTERENLADDAKGKGASGSHREAESTDASERGGLPRSSDEGPVMGLERRRWVIAADLGQLVRRRSPSFSGRRQPSCDGTSRMMREYPVRICEGLGANSLGLLGNRVGLTVYRRLPLYPYKQTSLPSVGMSQMCHNRKDPQGMAEFSLCRRARAIRRVLRSYLWKPPLN